MVHRSGSTLIITPNDGENSQNLPQFLDGLDPCADTTETSNKKSLTLPTKQQQNSTPSSSSSSSSSSSTSSSSSSTSFESSSSTRKRRTNTAQTKAINKTINTKSKQQQNQNKGSNNKTDINSDGHHDVKNVKALKNSNLLSQNKIRSGLRSNSLENIILSNDNAITTISVHKQTSGRGQRIKKKRKNEDIDDSIGKSKTRPLRKCISVESVFISKNHDDDNNEDEDNDNDDDVDDTTTTTTTTVTKEDEEQQQEETIDENEQEQELPLKLTCSLPLDKLTGILDSILITNRHGLSQTNLTNISLKIGDNNDNDDYDNELNHKQNNPIPSSSTVSSSSVSFDDGNSNISSNSNYDVGNIINGGIIGHSSQLIKSLCLYCDKKFSSQKVRIKHTERVHAIIRGRRLSSRNSISCPSNLSTSSSSLYPGCSYCCYNSNNLNISTITTTATTATTTSNSSNSGSNINNKQLNCTNSDDLKSLFHHLIEFHSDKYFACKLCTIRFLNSDDLNEHNVLKHKIGTFKRRNSIQTTNGASSSTATATTTTTMTSSLSSSSSTTITTANTTLITPSSSSSSTSSSSSLTTLSSGAAAAAVLATKSTLTKNKIASSSTDVNCSDLKITQPLHVEIESNDRNQMSNEKEQEEIIYDTESTPTKTRRQIKQAMENKQIIITRSCQNLLRSDETILSRLGITQNRLPRGRKGVRSRRLVTMDTIKNDNANNHHPPTNTVKTRSKVGRVITSNIIDIQDQTITTTPILRPPTSNRTETLCCTFDDDFYETVSLNVRKNLSCHIDGKLDGDPTSPSPLSPVIAIPTIRSTVVKSPLNHDSEIHEATSLSTVTAFPTLLTAEQYGSDLGGVSKIKRPITKHSWKWKWDSVKKYKYVNEGGKIVKKIKQPIIGLRDLSKLDMWTQLTMRTKHELARKQLNIISGYNETLGIGETAREEKRKQIAQLNTILDTRRLPQIVLEQSEQTVIKIEVSEDSNPCGDLFLSSSYSLNALESTPSTSSSSSLRVTTETTENDDDKQNYDDKKIENDEDSFPRMLNLSRRKSQDLNLKQNVVLSGEWARPRFYICFGCGSKFEKLKSLEEHKMFRHPYVYSTHYEIVGRELIEGDLYKHFYIPTKALNRHKEYNIRKYHITNATEDDGRDINTSSGIIENSTCGEDESMDSVNSIPVSNYTTGTSRSGDYETESKLNSIKSFSASSTISNSVDIEEESSTMAASSVVITTKPTTSTSTTSVARRTTTTTTTTLMTCYDSDDYDSDSSYYLGRKCTKCKRECGGLLELYRHILDCSGDYTWFMTKKRKYRYFGSKKRRRDHLRHNARLALKHRKQAAIRNSKNKNKNNGIKDETESSCNATDNTGQQHQQQQKKKNSPPTPRPPRPSDAESIRRMLENLPAKRACRQIIPNVTKPRVVKKLGIKKKGILIKKSGGTTTATLRTRSSGTGTNNGSSNNNGQTTKNVSKTTATAIAKNIRNRQKQIYTRRLRQLRSTRSNAQVAAAVAATKINKNIKKSNKNTVNEKDTIENRNNDTKSINSNNKNLDTTTTTTTATTNDATIASIVSPENLLAISKNNENVVKKLGKKTKCLVEKITHNLQKNKKKLLNKKTSSSNDVITTTTTTNTKKNDNNNVMDDNSSSSASSFIPVTAAGSAATVVKSIKNSKNNEENNDINKKDNENIKKDINNTIDQLKKDKSVITILEAKKMKKTRALIRRLSFCKTTRQTLTVMTATTTTSTPSENTEKSSSSSSSSKTVDKKNDNENSKNENNSNVTMTDSIDTVDSKDIEKSNGNNDKKLNPSTSKDKEENTTTTTATAETSSSSEKIPSSSSSSSKKPATKKSIRKILNRFKDKNKKSPNHETERMTTDIANENERTDDTNDKRENANESSTTTTTTIEKTVKESLKENSLKSEKNSKDNRNNDDEQKNVNNEIENNNSSIVPLQVDVPQDEQQQQQQQQEQEHENEQNQQQDQNLLNIPSCNGSCGNQISPTSKRRSKKLNDCIAMLTGKLEEKLGKSFFESNEENLDIALSRQSSTTDLNQEQQLSQNTITAATSSSTINEIDSIQQSTEDLTISTMASAKIESPTKRKTTTRKILKKDISNITTETEKFENIKNDENTLASTLASLPTTTTTTTTTTATSLSQASYCLADLTESVIRKSLNSDTKNRDVKTIPFPISSHEISSTSSLMIMQNQQNDITNTPRRLRSETQREAASFHSSFTSTTTATTTTATSTSLSYSVPSIISTATNNIPTRIAETTISLVPASISLKQTPPTPIIDDVVVSKTTNRRSNTLINRRSSIAMTTFSNKISENPFPFPTPENSLSCSSNLDFEDKNIVTITHSTPKEDKKPTADNIRNRRKSTAVTFNLMNDTNSSITSEIGNSLNIESFDTSVTTAAAKRKNGGNCGKSILSVRRKTIDSNESIICQPDITLNLITPEKEPIKITPNISVTPVTMSNLNEPMIFPLPFQSAPKRSNSNSRRNKNCNTMFNSEINLSPAPTPPPPPCSQPTSTNTKSHPFISTVATSATTTETTSIATVISQSIANLPAATTITPSSCPAIPPLDKNLFATLPATIAKAGMTKKKIPIIKPKKISSDDSILDSINAVISQSCSDTNSSNEIKKTNVPPTSQIVTTAITNSNNSKTFKGLEIISPPPSATPSPASSVLPILQEPPKNLQLSLPQPSSTLPLPPPPFLSGMLNPLGFPPLPPHQLNISPQNITAQMIGATTAAGIRRGTRRQSIATSKVPPSLLHNDSVLSAASGAAIDLRTYNSMMMRMPDYGDDNEGPIDLSTKPKRKNDNEGASQVNSKQTNAAVNQSNPVTVTKIPASCNQNPVPFNDRMSLRSFESSAVKQPPQKHSISNLLMNKNSTPVQLSNQEINSQMPVNNNEVSSNELEKDSTNVQPPPAAITIQQEPSPASQPPKKKFTGGRPSRRKTKSDENKPEDQLPIPSTSPQTSGETNELTPSKEAIKDQDIPKTTNSSTDKIEESLQPQITDDTHNKKTENISTPLEITDKDSTVTSLNSTSVASTGKKKRGAPRKKKDVEEPKQNLNDEKITNEKLQEPQKVDVLPKPPEPVAVVQDQQVKALSTRKITRKSKLMEEAMENVDDSKKEEDIQEKDNKTQNDSLESQTTMTSSSSVVEEEQKKEENVPSKPVKKSRRAATVKSTLSCDKDVSRKIEENSEKEKIPIENDITQKQSQAKVVDDVSVDTVTVKQQEQQEQQPKRRVTRSKSMAIVRPLTPSSSLKLSSTLKSNITTRNKKQQQKKQNKQVSEIESIVESFLNSDNESSKEEALEFAKCRASNGPIRLDDVEQVFGKPKDADDEDGLEDEDVTGSFSLENDGKSLNELSGLSCEKSSTEKSSNESNVSSVYQEVSINLVKIDEIYDFSKENRINIQNDDDGVNVNDKFPEIPPSPPRREKSKRIANRRGTFKDTTITTNLDSNNSTTVETKIIENEITVTEETTKVPPPTTTTTAPTVKRRGRKRLIQNAIEPEIDTNNTSSTSKTSENNKNTISINEKISGDSENSISTSDTAKIPSAPPVPATNEKTIIENSSSLQAQDSTNSQSSKTNSTTIAATTTTTTTTTIKQRRRRRNELAAIVADQLLESFKEVDKSRLDDLKMLENLAYEKSEDLFITGMRLTPTTKRKVLQEKGDKDINRETITTTTTSAGEKRKTDENLKKTKLKRSLKNQTKSKSTSDLANISDVDDATEKKKSNVEEDIPLALMGKTKTNKEKSDVSKKRKMSTTSNENKNTITTTTTTTTTAATTLSSISHENLFKNYTKNYNEPLKLNLEPLPQNVNFKISSNFNTTQFDIFSTFKSSFDTFRSLTESSFMKANRNNKNRHGRKQMTNQQKLQNFLPGSTETSNSLDSVQPSPNNQISIRSGGSQDDSCNGCKINETTNEKKSSNHKKLKKKMNKKKANGIGGNNIGKLSNEIENINELRNDLESFKIGKESAIIGSSFVTVTGNHKKKVFDTSTRNFSVRCSSSFKNTLDSTTLKSDHITPSSSSAFNFSSFSTLPSDNEKEQQSIQSNNKKPLLRPSILSNITPTEINSTSTTNKQDTQKTTPSEIIKPISSRDPRLNKNKLQKKETEPLSALPSLPLISSRPVIDRGRSSFSVRQRRKSEILLATNLDNSDDITTNRLRSSRRLRDARLNSEKSFSSISPLKTTIATSRVDISDGEVADDDDEDDTYLNRIAKSVKDKIMTSEEQEDFNEASDGFNLINPSAVELLQPPRPATSMGLSSIKMINDNSIGGLSEYGRGGDDDDDNTNTELIDMDLDDDISVYTSFSQDVSRLRNKGRFGGRRRRRKSILLSRRSKKQALNIDQTNETFDCTICNKSFKKSIALTKHRMTLTHIAKLSEHEYLAKQRQEKEQEEQERQRQEKEQEEQNMRKQQEEDEPVFIPDDDDGLGDDQSEDEDSVQIISPPPPPPSPQRVEIDDNLGSSSDKESEPCMDNDNRFEFEQAEPEPSATPLEAEPRLPAAHGEASKVGTTAEKSISSSSTSAMNLLNQPGIEPISSPEQMESNYDRYQNTSSRIALSQEERLFYECCNMLKGGETPLVERTYPVIPSTYSAYDVPNKPVTPKSSERFSYLGSDVSGNFQHGTAYTVKSPMSHSRSSPRHAYPKIDINQFSDISSDSNPAAAIHRTQPNQPLISSSMNYGAGGKDSAFNQHSSIPLHHNLPPQSVGGHSRTATGGISSFAPTIDGQMNRTNVYYGNGNNFAPSQFPSMARGECDAGQLSARTYVGNGRENNSLPQSASYPPDVVTIDKPTICVTGTGANRTQSFTSPVHSTSSQGSTITTTTSRMRTKAAMKGYDNFKVSIPTLGLDMQQALERSPHGGCKLSALAEIALGSEAPAPSSITASATVEPAPPPSTAHHHFSPFQQHQHQLKDVEDIGGNSICDKLKPKPTDINEKFAKKYHELIMNNMKPNKKKDGKTSPICKTLAAKKRTSPHKFDIEKPKDVYEFEDESDENDNEDGKPPTPGVEVVREECAASSPPIRNSSLSRNTCNTVEEKIIIPERPFKDIGLNEKQTIKFHKPDEIRTTVSIEQQRPVGTENNFDQESNVRIPGENQNDESIVSSTSYSDRDDGFNYGSMTENEEDESAREENENDNENDKKNLHHEDDDDDDDDNSSDSDSQSSARTAKTIREKSLIMGRIFKHANKMISRVEEKGQETILTAEEPPVVVQKNKLEAQQKELDKLFDSLRKEPEKIEIKPTTNGTSTVTSGGRTSLNSSNTTRNSSDKLDSSKANQNSSVTAVETTVIAPVAKKKPQRKTGRAAVNQKENKVETKAPQDQNQNKTAPSKKTAVTKPVEQKARKRGRKSAAEVAQQQQQQQSKEIHKLQAELGMSAEEIAELLSEGKRKSQRRCAANRPKKVVEIWSSDEYEEFLSTKDIIALIEEKEKKSKKRKPTTTTAPTPKSTAVAIEKKKTETNHVLLETSQQSTATTMPINASHDDKAKNSLTTDEAPNDENDDRFDALKKTDQEMKRDHSPSLPPPPKKPPEKIVDRLLEKLSQAKKAATVSDHDENKPLSQVLAETKATRLPSARLATLEIERNSVSSVNPTKKSKEKVSQQDKRPQRKPTLLIKPRVKSHNANAGDSESDFENEWRRGTFEGKKISKIKKRRKTISFKEAPKKSTTSSNVNKNQSITTTVTTTPTTMPTTTGKSKTSLSSSHAAGGNHKNSNRNYVGGAGAGAGTGGDNNNPNVRPLPRRKRVASEMLYYWSSSSSDEEFGRIETRDDDDDDLTDGEHYQQHGWIVGDSHKKLVTLLAIAKGKKAEDCGVKETVSKKK